MISLTNHHLWWRRSEVGDRHRMFAGAPGRSGWQQRTSKGCRHLEVLGTSGQKPMENLWKTHRNTGFAIEIWWFNPSICKHQFSGRSKGPIGFVIIFPDLMKSSRWSASTEVPEFGWALRRRGMEPSRPASRRPVPTLGRISVDLITSYISPNESHFYVYMHVL